MCDVNFENAMDLLYIAKKYCVDKLVKVCANFLRDAITSDTVCQIMEASRAISDSEVYDQCLSFMWKNFTDSLKSKDFPTLCMRSMEDVMAIENVIVKEEELYENLMRWAESECKRQTLNVSWENKRKVLGDILYKVRFPLMKRKYFTKKVATTDLLSDTEKLDVLMYLCSKDIAPKYFQVNERIQQVVRCVPVSCTNSVPMKNRTASLRFKVSHPSLLHGILVYGCSSGSCEYSVKVCVRDSSGKTLICPVETKLNTTFKTRVYPVMLEYSLPVATNLICKVHLEMCGSENTYSAKGIQKQSVSYGAGKSVIFGCLNDKAEDTCYGQIPGLLLT